MYGLTYLNHHPALKRHGVGHGEHEVVPSHRRHHGQPDPGVAAGGLHEGGYARLDLPALLRLLDHADRKE